MNLDLTNKTALVCGASQGLGAAVAHELAMLGAHVWLMARNEENLKAVKQSLDISLGQQHGYFVADSGDPEHIQQLITDFLSKGKSIDILVNNTGGPPAGPLLNTSLEDMQKGVTAHLLTAHSLAKLVVPGMKANKFGRIINILSTAVKQPINGLGISNTVRAGVANWAKTLANEIGQYGITVNNVLPGYTKTDRLDYLFGKQASEAGTTVNSIVEKTISMSPAGRVGEPEEYDAAVASSWSPEVGYSKGINLPWDVERGGYVERVWW
ncbi:MAG: SDR family NAD(P)-dependent oxidoreductase, partial [Chitinophagaceae bacterium]|nr:SDR family NAD(P)-dependent oxidoreductase [Chitinophagaceae bacterium]